MLARWAIPTQPGEEPELAYYLCAGPTDTGLEQLIAVAGGRWRIEECFQAAKSEAGLASYQVRDYTAWYRHITLVMLAHAYLSATRATAKVDHVGHGDEKRPMNSVRKTGIVQGAMYLVEVIPAMEFGRDRVGQSTVTLHKDNMGGIWAAKGETVARFMMASTEGGQQIECKLLAPDDTATAMQQLVDLGTAHARRKLGILNLLADGSKHSKTKIREAVGGMPADIRLVLDELLGEELIVTGKGGGRTEYFWLAGVCN